ncbi:MAG: hypothetical protein AAFS01_08820 [Pseudomonadota bacterium]
MQSGTYLKLNKALRGLSEQDALALGARAALRALPIALVEGADGCDMYLLAAFRGAIVHAAACSEPSPAARRAARSAALWMVELGHIGSKMERPARQAFAAANGAARAGSFFFDRVDPDKGVANAATDALRACANVWPEAETVIVRDVAAIDVLDGAVALFQQPLFPDNWEDLTAPERKTLDRYLAAEPEKWAFWHAWYNGYVNGQPLEWDLQREVALLPEHVWLESPVSVARHIERIKARMATVVAVRDAEDELRSAARTRHGIGGNFPPEPIDLPSPSVTDALLAARAPLREISAQVEMFEPELTVIQSALAQLKEFLNMGFRWVAGKADLAVDTTIKWGIPAVGGGYLALNPDKIEAVILAAEKWLLLAP